jgi:Cysteine rich repeat
MMRNRFLALALLSLPLSTAALADRQGSPDEQRACLRDVQRFCRHLMDQGDFTVLACLKENRPKISSACDTVLKTHGQ